MILPTGKNSSENIEYGRFKVVFLCGMMSVGKTAVGQEMAKHADMQHIDTDAVIEAKYGKISDIFAQHGEEFFRKVESQTLIEIINTLRKDVNYVISLGGGTVLSPENVRLIKSVGVTVWLKADADTLFNRCNTLNRPLLQQAENDKNVLKNLSDILLKREQIYQLVADYALTTDNLTINQTAKKIIDILRLTV